MDIPRLSLGVWPSTWNVDEDLSTFFLWVLGCCFRLMANVPKTIEMDATKESLIAEIEKRVSDKILEQSNADLLIKLINNADSLDEAINIAALGTTYKRTGLHFDKRLEKMSDTIRYFKKNEKLSFHTDDSKPTHKLIIGDNYEALQNLLIEYRGKVDVIYIDPPYGKDSMGEFAQTNYNNAITRDNLLSMLYPRLVLAKQLLSDSGVIFCSIDDKNQAYVKCLFDEVMGEENFIANIIWERAFSPVNLKKHFSESHDYVICYAKKITDCICNGLQRSDETNNRYSNPDNDNRGVWASSDLSVGPRIETKVYEIITPSGRKVLPPNGYCWRLDKETFEKYKSDNRIWFGEDGNGVPRIKRFLSEVKQGITPMTIWKHTEVGHSQSATKDLKRIFGDSFVFPYPKPIGLIYRLISLYSKEDSIILDFFAGSGTTGHAVLDLNRNDAKDGDLLNGKASEGNRTFILCQLNEKTDTTPNGIAYDVTSKRLKRIMTGECYDGTKDFEWIKKNKPYGGNLDVYEIEGVSNFEWTEGKTPFDMIDETLYGKKKFATVREKIDWVCQNFDKTQKYVENDEEWTTRIQEEE
ncbi:MAG: site-specific DNA-methyltransferase [Paludibacteraceae bacterium]|nr:site-specific DNA-methyltransferase [Paludibacteraceae bacterium]